VNLYKGNKRKAMLNPLIRSMSPTKSIASAPESGGKRKVSFQEHNDQHECPARLQLLSLEEIASIWYNRADYISFHDEARVTVVRYQQASMMCYSGTSCDDVRGLEEGLTMHSSRKRSAGLRAVYKAVLEEQHSQKQQTSGFVDPIQISKRSMIATSAARLRAQELAAQDVEAVRAAEMSLSALLSVCAAAPKADDVVAASDKSLRQLHLERQRRLLSHAMAQTSALRS
jgi:hypothetical protein